MDGGGGAGMMGGSSNPVLTMLLMQFAMADPSAMSLPVVSMLMRNPTLMQNPMGAMMISSMLGVDVNKVATPLAMVNGMGGGVGSLMRWLPLMTGDPNMMSLMFSMGGLGGMGMGGLGGMGTMIPMIAANM